MVLVFRDAPDVNNRHAAPTALTATNQPLQWQGVYPLPAEQMQQLNRVLLRELTSGEHIRISRNKRMIPCETALQRESFFSYDFIAWARRCVEEEYAAMHQLLTPGAHTLLSMFSRDAHAAQSTTPRYEEGDKALLQRFLIGEHKGSSE